MSVISFPRNKFTGTIIVVSILLIILIFTPLSSLFEQRLVLCFVLHALICYVAKATTRSMKVIPALTVWIDALDIITFGIYSMKSWVVTNCTDCYVISIFIVGLREIPNVKEASLAFAEDEMRSRLYKRILSF